jgi:hypothetical protein
MITKCDRYWWQLNKVYLIILLCSLPFDLAFPVLSLIMPILILYGSCDKFLVFHGCEGKHDDSMRFIMTMPFSRQQIFDTYIKGSLSISIGYAIAVGLLRLILMLTKFSYVLFWSNNLNNGYGLFIYMALLTISLLSSDLFLISLVNQYTTYYKSCFILISLFVMLPLCCLWQYLKYILLFVSGLIQISDGVVSGTNSNFKLNMLENIAAIASVTLFTVAIIVLICCLRFVKNRQRKRYIAGEYQYVW